MEQFFTYDFFGITNGRTLLVVMHLFGLALGAGAAFFSDFLFTHILKDRKISNEEYAILKLVSMVVWIGLALLIVSGFMLFLGNPDRLLDSSKFLAKMTIVGILTVNGVLFHVKHIPFLGSLVNKDLRKNKGLAQKMRPLFVSGAVSGVSWASALFLGAIRGVDYSYIQIMAAYLVLVLIASLSAVLVHKLYFSQHS